MNPRWLLRMAKWARHPPSRKQLQMIFGVLALCLLLLAVERFVGWPEWATVDRMRP